VSFLSAVSNFFKFYFPRIQQKVDQEKVGPTLPWKPGLRGWPFWHLLAQKLSLTLWLFFGPFPGHQSYVSRQSSSRQ